LQDILFKTMWFKTSHAVVSESKNKLFVTRIIFLLFTLKFTEVILSHPVAANTFKGVRQLVRKLNSITFYLILTSYQKILSRGCWGEYLGLRNGNLLKAGWKYVEVDRPGRSQWPRRLRCGSAAARLLGLRVRIPSGVMDVCLLWVLCVVR